ncbi:hypothetical protein BC830DRAFT_1100831 [Chytriomyces sp. MP71]|nr:hypothetical protein BC830DRAFT_1100831 [Chytriomyces sp. MP71]
MAPISFLLSYRILGAWSHPPLLQRARGARGGSRLTHGEVPQAHGINERVTRYPNPLSSSAQGGYTAIGEQGLLAL